MDVRRNQAPYAAPLRSRRALLDRGARRVVEICNGLGDVRAVYAFGSCATGIVRLGSDLDVLVRDTKLRRGERDLAIRNVVDVARQPKRP